MKLTQSAIDKINTRSVILELALALDFSEQWINRLIAANKDNGPLTTAKALQVIGKETGLDNDKILEEETVNESISKAS